MYFIQLRTHKPPQKTNKVQQTNHPKQSTTFPSLNFGPLAVQISDETGVETEGIISLPEQRLLLSISEE
jgi:hypothetical protein